jgi:uncharacterized membrane protein YqjE
MRALEEFKRYFVDGTAILLLGVLPVILLGLVIWSIWPTVIQIAIALFFFVIIAIAIGIFVDIVRDAR